MSSASRQARSRMFARVAYNDAVGRCGVDGQARLAVEGEAGVINRPRLCADDGVCVRRGWRADAC